MTTLAPGVAKSIQVGRVVGAEDDVEIERLYRLVFGQCDGDGPLAACLFRQAGEI